MQEQWFIGAFIAFVLGYVLSQIWLGWIIGVPLITLSVFFIVIGFIMPDNQ